MLNTYNTTNLKNLNITEILTEVILVTDIMHLKLS